MASKCPHCGKEIELLSAGDLKDGYGINANQLQHARETGNFPDPWVALNNRNLWLRADIEEYASIRGRAKVEETVKELMRAMAGLPPAEAKAAEKLLREELSRKGK